MKKLLMIIGAAAGTFAALADYEVTTATSSTYTSLDSLVADVGQRASASQAACRIGLAKRGFAITSNQRKTRRLGK